MTTVTSNSFSVSIVAPVSSGGLPDFTMDEATTTCYAFNGTLPWGVHKMGETGAGTEAPSYGRQGQWLDLYGAPFGNVPFSSIFVADITATDTLIQLDLTALATNWATYGNRGLMLRWTGPEAQFRSRNYVADTSKRPYLLVTRPNSTTFRRECTADVSLDRATPGPTLGLLQNFNCNAAENEVYISALQFEAITEAFTSVTLYVVCYNTDNEGTLQSYLLNPPVAKPSWAPASGNAAVISLNTIANVYPGVGIFNGSSGPNSNSQHYVFSAWNSGGFLPWFSPRGAYYAFGGGDGDYWGNEVYIFSLGDVTVNGTFFAALTWTRWTSPSTNMDGTAAATDPNFNLTWGEHGLTNGIMAVPHTYDGLETVPWIPGAGQRGAIVMGPRRAVYRQTGYNTAHTIDPGNGNWTRASTGSLTALGASDTTSAVYYPPTRRIYYFSASGTPAYDNKFYYLDLSSGFPGVFGTAVCGDHLRLASPTTRYWKGEKKLVQCGDDGNGNIVFRVYDPASPSVGVTPTLIGASFGAFRGSAFDIIETTSTFVYRSSAAGHEQKIWTIQPPRINPFGGGSWVVTEVTIGGATISGRTHNGMWKRWSFDETSGCFIFCNENTGAVYAVAP